MIFYLFLAERTRNGAVSATLPMPTPSEEFIRKLVSESGLSLREIARRATIDPQPLQLWMRGTSASLKLELADKICLALTDKHLVDVTGEEAA